MCSTYLGVLRCRMDDRVFEAPHIVPEDVQHARDDIVDERAKRLRNEAAASGLVTVGSHGQGRGEDGGGGLKRIWVELR